MLVLSRKKNESIVINHDITIVVVEIRGDKVRLGIEAPKDVQVHRQEVYDAIERQQRTASAHEPDASVPSVYAHQAHIDARRQNREDFEKGNNGDVPDAGESQVVNDV